MSPATFGFRVAVLVWVVGSFGAALYAAVGALASGSDAYSAAIWGVFAGSLLAMPLLGVSVLVGAGGATLARACWSERADEATESPLVS